MEPVGSMPHSQGPTNNTIQSRINPIARTDIYLFKFHSIIAFTITSRMFSEDSFLKIYLLKF